MAIELFDARSGTKLGEISEDQLKFLTSHMEEEDSNDQDYYISRSTISYFEGANIDPELLKLLQNELGDNESMDVRWQYA